MMNSKNNYKSTKRKSKLSLLKPSKEPLNLIYKNFSRISKLFLNKDIKSI